MNEKIKKILHDADILRLIEQGAPDDEYDLEIPQIVKIMNDSLTQEEFSVKLFQFYQEILGHSDIVGEYKAYESLARNIWMKLR